MPEGKLTVREKADESKSRIRSLLLTKIPEGKFIVFEGIDGCGKGTQLWKLAKYISDLSKYNHILLTREPYKKQEIRNILNSEDDPYSQAEKLAELFVEDRKEHAENLITPALEKGKWVLCDRYKLSTIAYQSAQGVELEKLKKLNENFPIPDITFIIDLPVEIAREHMNKDSIRTEEQKFEKDISFQEKVRQNYLKCKSLFPDENILIINGNRSVEEIFEEIKQILDNYIN